MENRKKGQGAGALLLALILAACSGDSPEALLQSAKSQVASKDYKAAVIQLKNALQRDPSLAEARFMLGQILLDSGDVVGALVELGKAEELGYTADRVVPAMSRALLAQQAFDKLIAKFSAVQLTKPEAIAEVKVALGSAYVAKADFDAADRSADEALRAVSNYEDAELLKIRVTASRGDFEGALSRLDKALERSPNSSKAWLLRGELLARDRSKTDLARAAFREAIKHDAGNIGGYVGLIPMLLQAHDLDGAKVEIERLRAIAPGAYHTIYFTGWHALESGELDRANENAQRLLKVLPDKPDVLYLAGATQARRNALTQAEDLLAKALSIEPNMGSVRMLLAQTHLRRGDAAKALAVLQPMLTTEAPWPQALALAAEAQLMSGQIDQAEALFSRAAKLDPGNTSSHVALANAKLAKGQIDEGLASLRQIAGTDKGTAADLALVNEYWRRRRFDEAMTALDALNAKSPGQAHVMQLRGNIELSRGRHEAAREAYESALKLDARYFPAVAKLADLEVQEKHGDKARTRVEKFIEADPKNAAARMLLVRIRAQAGAAPDELAEMLSQAIKIAPTEREPRLALVRLYLSKPDVKQAISTAQLAVAALPDDPEVLQLLGQAQLASGDKNQAVSTFGKLTSEHPKMPQPYLLLADAYARGKDDAAAMQAIRRGISAVPQYMPSYQALTALEMAAGRPKAALEVAKAAQKQASKDSTGYLLEGDIALAQKDLARAAAIYKLGLERSEAPALAIRLHRTSLAMGKRDDALTLERQRLQKFPGDAAFLTYLADLAIVEGRLDDAEQRYAQLLALQPNNGPALNNMAWVLYKLKKQGALAYAERANDVVPNRPEFIDTLAEITAGGGNYKQAIDLQRRAVSLAPDYQAHRLHLARYLAMAGQKQEARIELESLAKLGDKFKGQDEVAKLLKSL